MEKKKMGRMTLDELKVLLGYSQLDTDLTAFEGQALARVHVIGNQVEAQIIQQGLEQEGIPCLIQSHHDTAYDGLFQSTMGWGQVITREEDAARAADCIRSLLESWIPEADD